MHSDACSGPVNPSLAEEEFWNLLMNLPVHHRHDNISIQGAKIKCCLKGTIVRFNRYVGG
jgi:hypothetical protein